MTAQGDESLPGMIGQHPAMLEVYRLVHRAAEAALPVVILGETGTGKELVAHALHGLAGSSERPFVDVNCAAIPDSLAEAELFGWERGAFTGAHYRTSGLLEAAHGGTLFLDEACSLPLSVQAKLLRALEQGDFRHVGGRRTLSAAFRIVVAVSEPLTTLVAARRMREDFAYRIAGITISLPPLRARGHDVRLLAEHFLGTSKYNRHPPKTLDPGALDVLARHRWPGNVRELEMVLEQLSVCVDRPMITAADLLHGIPALQVRLDGREALEAALAAHGWRVEQAARALGVGRTTLYDRMRQLAIRRPGAPG